MSDNAFNWILSIFTSSWNWLSTYNYHGVSLQGYILGLLSLGILIKRVFK